MKLKNYLVNENTFKQITFWISPKGEILVSEKDHIEIVKDNPEKFELTDNEIKNIYNSYGNGLSQQDKAKESIIRRIIFKKFIRIRKYDKYYTINALMKNFLNKEYLTKWARLMLGPGISGFKETNKDFPVIITDFGSYHKKTTIGEIANKGLYESYINEKLLNHDLIIKNKIEDFS